MKRTYLYLTVLLIVASFSIIGCEPLQDFEQENLVGTWYTSDLGGMYYTFYENGTGRSENSAKQGLNFTWTLDGESLVLRYEGQSSVAYDDLVVTTLNATTLKCYYSSDPSDKLSFVKQ